MNTSKRNIMYRIQSKLLCRLTVMICSFLLVSSENQPSSTKRWNTKTLQFVSPLQSLTIFSKDDVKNHPSPREEYLDRLKAGLTAEERVREKLATSKQETTEKDPEYVGPGWDKKSLEKERNRIETEALRLEQAFDAGVRRLEKSKDGKKKESAKVPVRSEYQFVGVIQPPSDENIPLVKWYARKRPSDQSKWNVRLVHVNRDAILRDLFVRGKLDIYGEYVNAGKFATEKVTGDEEPSTTSRIGRPLIQGRYSVRERSWRTLWNFNPLHFFTDSSGAFWRERRLSPGLYTDGKLVYESIYRYSDGKNGMKPVSVLDDLMKSKLIDKKVKKRLLEKLKSGSPDVVIEE